MRARLLAVTPGDAHLGRPLQQLLEAMAGAGLEAVILREPGLGERALVALARALSPHFGPGLILHARHPSALDVASAAGWGLHLPSGADLLEARRRVRGPLGASCHGSDELLAAKAAGCDYALLSPIFPPTSKPSDARPTLGLDGLRRLALPDLPIYALGGLTPERGRAARAAGAMGAAVLGDLFPDGASPEDCAARVRAWRAALG